MRNNRYAIFLIIVALIYLLSGCASGKETKYNTKIETLANDGISTNNTNETPLWKQEYFKTFCKQEYICNVLGLSLKGSYLHSIIGKNNSYTTNYYVCDGGEMFGVRSDNGKIIFIDLMNNEFMKTEPYLDDIDNAEDVCREKAIEIANELIGDLNDYLEEQSKPLTQMKEKDGIQHTITYYYFTFYKQYAGYKTSDYITVRVTSKGHLASVIVGDTNAINNNIEIDNDELEKAINAKLESVYSNNDYLINNRNVEEQIIVKGPDGKYYIYTTMRINLLDNGNSINTAICLLTLIS